MHIVIKLLIIFLFKSINIYTLSILDAIKLLCALYICSTIFTIFYLTLYRVIWSNNPRYIRNNKIIILF